MTAKPQIFCGTFNPFGEDSNPESATKCDNTLANCLTLMIGIDVSDELAINFGFVEFQAFQVAKA